MHVCGNAPRYLQSKITCLVDLRLNHHVCNVLACLLAKVVDVYADPWKGQHLLSSTCGHKSEIHLALVS